MEQELYRHMVAIEDGYWWYVGLRDLVGRVLAARRPTGANVRVLDAGCGTGSVVAHCRPQPTWGLDVDPVAVGAAQRRVPGRIVRGSVGALPFVDASFAVVLCLDVLYHRAVSDDVAALLELRRVLEPGGTLVLHLPACRWLRGDHDVVTHARQRYARTEVCAKLDRAGFVCRRVAYRNSLLFPLAGLVRLGQNAARRMGLRRGAPTSDLRPLPTVLNRMLTALLRFENRLVLGGVHFPVGLSIVAIAERPG